MLCELRIENLALIGSAHLSFDRQGETALVVMTGETGAGKSIMLRAIGLLTGRRASVDWIRAGEESCTVEALFEVDDNYQHVRGLLNSGGFGDETTIIIKRIITRKGRSRIYINGSLATARFVSEIGYHLINIASQHDHQQLLQPQMHLDFLDTLGEHWPRRKQVQQLYDSWQQSLQTLTELRSRDRDREQRIDFLTFQVKEIRAVNPVEGEDNELTRDRKRLKSADSLIKLSRESLGILSMKVVDELSLVRKLMEQLSSMDPEIADLAADLSDYAYLAEDYSSRLRAYSDGLENDPSRLDAVNERLAELQTLKRKYGETISDVLGFAEQAETELQQIENLDKEIAEQQEKTEQIEKNLLAVSSELSAERKKTAQLLERSMADELSTLAFNEASIEVRFEETEAGAAKLKPTGFDRLEFFFEANPGEPPRPLAKIASGGELSRLMLAMKCLLAKKDMVETVIFDEVDAGVGGEAAEAVAKKIRELAEHHQVICITHLPQIAARGTEHLKVEKEVVNGRTQSTVALLTEEHRVSELARMLAGSSPTEQTQAWASELLTKGRAAA
jgi:DNA repair protein RecN (Recombination protein N)